MLTGMLLWAALAGAGEAPACMRPTTEALAQGRAAEAAALGEACWREAKYPAALLAASQAWLQAGEPTRAWLAAHRVLAAERAGRDMRRVAELVLREAAARTSAVKLVVVPPPVATEELEIFAQRSDVAKAEPIRFKLAELGPNAQLRLEAGAWTLAVKRAGYSRATVPVRSEIGADATVTVEMRQRAVAPPEEISLHRTPVTLVFGPEAAVGDGVELELRRDELPGASAMKLRIEHARATVLLTPGAWTARVRAPGRAEVERAIAVGRDATVNFDLR